MVRQEFEFHPSQVKFVSPDGQTIKGLQLDDNGALSVPLLNYQMASTDATSTTSSTSYVVIDSMTVTPIAGTWWVSFSSSGNGSAQNADLDFAIFMDGSVVSGTTRRNGHQSGQQNKDTVRPMHTQAIIATTGTEVIDVRYKTSSGTFSVYERNLILVRVG